MVTPRSEWTDRAACKGMAAQRGYDLFYDPDYEREAKAICRDCTVRMDCLREALRDGVWDGIYGGLTPRERTSHYRRWRYWCRTRGETPTRESLEQWNQDEVG